MEHGERRAKKHWVMAVIEDVFRLFVFVCFGIGLPLELLQIILVEERPGGSLYVLKNSDLSLEKGYLFLLFYVLGLCHVFLVGWVTYSSKQSKIQLIPFRKRKSEEGISILPSILFVRILLVFYIIGVVAISITLRYIARIG
ncbi:MAG: hypothetical protein JW849_01435 [Phycisphaerae bacterium]|nr:hypothetical protein [Phycisphaerae bacterium]